MLDLYNNQYDRKILKENIYAVKLMDILKTQKIDVNFAVRYLLNKKYQLTREDDIRSPDILKYQPHISYDELQKALLDYDSDDDSIDDFETISNRK
jgi:CRISPR/Cas system-associated protein Cas5 (RAMP superfamily)